MSGSTSAHASLVGPANATAVRPPSRRLLTASVACLGAGVLAAVAAFSPWWSTTTSSAGTSSTAVFYPGGNLYAGGGGGGGFASYTSAGLPLVGDLYVGVLVLGLAVAVLGLGLAVYGFGLARGAWGSPSARRGVRAVFLATVVLSVFLAVAVPLGQPSLFRADNPLGSCSAAPPVGACGSFWGTSHGSGTTTSWGAGLGWWLIVVSVSLLVAALLIGASATFGTPARARPEAASPARALAAPSPLALADLRRLRELKRLADAGEVPEEVFLDAKRTLLSSPVPSAPAGPGQGLPLPSEELELLRSLHDSGALNDVEYELLERRALLWI